MKYPMDKKAETTGDRSVWNIKVGFYPPDGVETGHPRNRKRLFLKVVLN